MKTKKFKKVMAAAVSAATMISCSSTMSMPVTNAAGDSNYMEALALSLYFFDANQCGTEVDDNCLTWRGNCHTYDAQASLSNAKNFDSSLTSIVDPDGDGKVDVSGGYHDAGDHVKFNLTMAFAASSLGMSEYMNPGIYEKAGCRDHLNYIIKNTADYFMKTTFLDGSGNVAAICATVSDEGDHGFWTSPESQTYDRPTYWLTKGNNNASISAEMSSAFSAAAYLLKDSDPAYAAECIKYAKALLDFTKQNPGLSNNPNGSMYNLGDTHFDEQCIAEAWLYINGEGSLPSVKPNGDKSYTVNGQKYYDGYLYSWDKVWSGYAALMYKITGDESFASEVKTEISGQGGLPTSSYNGNGWGASRYNCALQFCGIATGDQTLIQGAKFQMDHILGNNNHGYSFLIGYGDKWPTHIHHRAANPGDGNQTSAQNPDSKYVLYGALVGGDDAGGNYQDHADSYQFTEPALDYNACFALACASLANIYGGDASAVNDVIEKATEIDESYEFGGTPQLPTDPTDPTDPTNPTDPTDPTDPTGSIDYIPGDVNNDSVVNVFDAVLMRRYFIEYNVDLNFQYQPTPFDTNGDGKVEIADLVLLSQYITGKDVELKKRDEL